MADIGARELRNSTADVLRRVAAGEQVTITSRGRHVAQLTPLPATGRRPITRAALIRRLGRTQPERGALHQGARALA